MIKITVKQLQKLGACQAGIAWFVAQKKRSLKLVIKALLKDNHFDYAKWLLKNLLTKEQNVLWAIESAKSVLKIFEDKYPKDNRPRKAIEAAEKCLKNPTKKNVAAANAAAYAAYAAYAANAAYAAAYAAYAAYAAADAAADAANAAYAAANAAAYAANAAYAAADAAYAAYAANIVRKEKEIEICNFALKLLGEI